MLRRRGRPNIPTPRVPVPQWDHELFRSDLATSSMPIEEIAVVSGIGVKTLYSWASGRTIPRADYLAVVATVLKHPIGRWFTEPKEAPSE